MDRKRELDLVKRAQTGDRDSYGQLVDLYGGVVLAIAYSRVGNYTASQDIAQDAFLLGFENLAKLNQPHRFGTWLKTITKNLCNNWFKSQAYRDRLREDSVNLRERPEYREAVGPEEEMHRKETLRMIDEALKRLPLRDRETIILYYFEGKLVHEAAKALDISVEAMKKRLQRARKRLREELAAHVEAGLLEAGRARKMSSRILAAIPLGASYAKIAPVASVLPSLPLLHLAGILAKMGGIVMGMKTTSGIVVAICVALIAIAGGLQLARLSRSAEEAPVQPSIQGFQPDAVQGASAEEPPVRSSTRTQAEEPEPMSPALFPVKEVEEEEPTSDEEAEAVLAASVSGYVRDDKGYAVEGARIYVEIGEDFSGIQVLKTYGTRTGADGRYAISGIDTFGHMVAYASAEGYAMQRAWGRELSPGANITDVNFTLPEAAYFVAGKVVSESMVPIPGASVQLRYYGYDEEGLEITARTGRTTGNITDGKFSFAITDGEGRFEIAVDDEGLCDFTVTKDGYGAGFFPRIPAGTEDALFVLHSHGAIAGKVTREDASPVENAEMEVVGRALPGGLEPSEVSVQTFPLAPVVIYTDATGAYLADGLSEDYVYAVSATDTSDKATTGGSAQEGDGIDFWRNMLRGQPVGARKQGIHVKAGKTTTGVDLVLGAAHGAIIYGNVTEAQTGLPVYPLGVFAALADAAIQEREMLGGGMNVAVTSPDGSYELALDLTERTTVRVFWRHVHTGGFGPLTEDAEVATLHLDPDAREELNFTVPAVPFSVPIRFVGKHGEPLAGIRAGIHLQDRGWGLQSTLMTSGDDGLVTWRGLTPGETYVALGFDKDFNMLGTSQRFTGQSGETIPEVVVVCLARGGIEGIALDVDGNPVANTEVVCAAPPEDGSMSNQRETTDANGAFCMLSALPEGIHPRIFIMRGDSQQVGIAVVENVEIVADAIIDLGTVVLQPVSMEQAAEMLSAG